MFHINDLLPFDRSRISHKEWHTVLWCSNATVTNAEQQAAAFIGHRKGPHWPRWWGPQYITYLPQDTTYELHGERLLVTRALHDLTRQEFHALPHAEADNVVMAWQAAHGLNPYWSVAIAGGIPTSDGIGYEGRDPRRPIGQPIQPHWDSEDWSDRLAPEPDVDLSAVLAGVPVTPTWAPLAVPPGLAAFLIGKRDRTVKPENRAHYEAALAIVARMAEAAPHA